MSIVAWIAAVRDWLRGLVDRVLGHDVSEVDRYGAKTGRKGDDDGDESDGSAS